MSRRREICSLRAHHIRSTTKTTMIGQCNHRVRRCKLSILEQGACRWPLPPGAATDYYLFAFERLRTFGLLAPPPLQTLSPFCLASRQTNTHSLFLSLIAITTGRLRRRPRRLDCSREACCLLLESAWKLVTSTDRNDRADRHHLKRRRLCGTVVAATCYLSSRRRPEGFAGVRESESECESVCLLAPPSKILRSVKLGSLRRSHQCDATHRNKGSIIILAKKMNQ